MLSCHYSVCGSLALSAAQVAAAPWFCAEPIKLGVTLTAGPLRLASPIGAGLAFADPCPRPPQGKAEMSGAMSAVLGLVQVRVCSLNTPYIPPY